MQSSKIDRIKDLVEQLNAASESYYAKDQEIMSNYEYDKLYDELVELEKETGVTLANSPTVNVGYEAVDELPKERHESPMLSLGKTKSREELRDRGEELETEFEYRKGLDKIQSAFRILEENKLNVFREYNGGQR